MGKIIFFCVLGLVFFVALKAWAHRARRSEERVRAPESMVACAHCAVNLPRSEAVEHGGRFYCNREHERLGPR